MISTLARPASSTSRLLPADENTLIGWHRQFAVNPSSLAALTSMTHLLTLPGVPGGLGLQRVGRVLVASGDPLAPTWAWSALALALTDFCRDTGKTACFGPVGSEFAGLLARQGLVSVRLGSAPYIHLPQWPLHGDAGANIRHARNRARRDGLTLSERPWQGRGHLSADWRAEVEALCAEWLSSRQAGRPFRWIFRLQPLAFHHHKRYFEARQEGRLVGLVAASPLQGRDSWYLEDIIRATQAPASMGTALVAHALDVLRDSGVTTATLGGVPLSQERGQEAAAVTPLERLAYGLRPLLTRLYSFGGLERFKRRFGPAHWEDEHLVLPPGPVASLMVAATLARLILRGG